MSSYEGAGGGGERLQIKFCGRAIDTTKTLYRLAKGHAERRVHFHLICGLKLETLPMDDSGR